MDNISYNFSIVISIISCLYMWKLFISQFWFA
jgi:hypothetical protein